MKINENLFLITPQNKIGKLLEKRNDQRITIITSNSSLKSSKKNGTTSKDISTISNEILNFWITFE